MPTHGFLRVAAAVPKLRVADVRFNVEQHLKLLQEAEDAGVRLVAFPECSLTGYTCGDLFHQETLLRAAEEGLQRLLKESAFTGVAVVGLPVMIDAMVFNCAAVAFKGRMLGLVPKSYLPNYKEFYDVRYFAPARNLKRTFTNLAGQSIDISQNYIWMCNDFTFGVEICEDLWMPIPPSSRQANRGATVLLNLSASNETIGKAAFRRQLVASQSARCLAAYIYCSSGNGESTTDLVFGGHSIIAENGSILVESERFRDNNHLTIADLDLQHLQHDRSVTNSFNDQSTSQYETNSKQMLDTLHFGAGVTVGSLHRVIDPHPFVPNDPATLKDRCDEIFHIQTTALGRRLEHVGKPTVSIGVSGGLDSTLALLVLCKTADAIGMPRSKIRGLTMPGFGTTDRTRRNAWTLMTALGLSGSEIDIKAMCFDQMNALDHRPFGIHLEAETVASFTEKLRHLPPDRRSDLTFENTQARVRTSLLMNAGFTLGTGDLSELCLGWCTYNADHMSMYNPNISIPKTLVKFLVKWVAENEFDGEVRTTLLDVLATEISPELLPIAADGKVQSTEATVGPYELHDFFIYHMLRWGSPPEKILFLASQAKFDVPYAAVEIKKWLTVFLKRFFASQFKRSCLPDGPKVGSVSVSPRGDWRMPSDAYATAWLDSLERE
ncbi:NAD(+) synthase [soil metagenome]